MTPLESLQRERLGYVNRGLTDRVAQVDALIRKLGGKTDTAAPVVEAAAKPAPRKR